jgi:pantothenate synthetase
MIKRVETNKKIEIGDIVRDNTGLALAVQSISNNAEGVFLLDEACEAEEYLCEIIGMTLEKHERIIKEKDKEIAELKERLKPFLEKESKEKEHLEAYEDYCDLSDAIREGKRGN